MQVVLLRRMLPRRLGLRRERQGRILPVWMLCLAWLLMPNLVPLVIMRNQFAAWWKKREKTAILVLIAFVGSVMLQSCLVDVLGSVCVVGRW